MPDLSVVIVNYNTREDLRACIESILAVPDALDIEIIVVDNASSDGSADMVRQYPAVTLIAPGQNTWFSGGNNLGVQAASGDYVFILNPDTVVPPGLLLNMVNALRDDPAIGALTCRMVYPDGNLQRTCSRMPQYVDLLLDYTFLGVLLSGWRSRRRARMWYSDWGRDSDQAVEVVPASALMSPRRVLDAQGVFDTNMRLYFVEDDLCRRLRDAGYAVRFHAGDTLLHKEHSSVQQVQRLASRVYFQDLRVFCRKYHGRWRAVLLDALMTPTRWAMAAVQRWRG